MIFILFQIVGGWLFSGFIGWVVGVIIDYIFYKDEKGKWDVLLGTTLLGPFVWLVILSVLINLYFDRKEN